MWITLHSYNTITRICKFARIDRDDLETNEIVLLHPDPVSLFGKALHIHPREGIIIDILTMEEYVEMLNFLCIMEAEK